MDEYILVERSATSEEYLRLLEAVGWICQDIKATEIGLHNSLFSVCMIYRDEVIGHGRVVGDGSIQTMIEEIDAQVHVASHPEEKYKIFALIEDS